MKMISKFKSFGTKVSPHNKLVLIGATIATTAIVGSAGVAAAQQFDNHDQGPPAIVAKCKEHYRQLGFKNVGQCVSYFEHQQHGYGGDGDHDHDDQHHNQHQQHHHHDYFGFFHHFHFRF